MLNNNRGIALLITVSAIVVLVAVGFELNRQIQSSASKTGLGRDMMKLQQKVASGISLGKAVLVEDKYETEADSVQENWADSDFLRRYLTEAGFAEDEIFLEITDELGRLQLNALVNYPDNQEFNPPQHRMWQRFFRLVLEQYEGDELYDKRGLADFEADMIVNPVKDWLDSGDDDAETGLSGAEQGYYAGLDPPYSCRNGPARHISELMLVKNIDPGLFSGLGGNTGINDFLTVHGMVPSENDRHEYSYPGKININTAPVPVLAALLPEGHEFLAGEVAAYREETADGEYVHDLRDDNWYKEVPGLQDVEIDSSLITTQSDFYRIKCRARQNDSSLEASAVVQRVKQEETGKWTCRVLKWEYE